VVGGGGGRQLRVGRKQEQSPLGISQLLEQYRRAPHLYFAREEPSIASGSGVRGPRARTLKNARKYGRPRVPCTAIVRRAVRFNTEPARLASVFT